MLRSHLLLLSLLLLSLVMVACGDDEPIAQPVNTVTSTAALNSDLRLHLEGFSSALHFLEGSSFVDSSINAVPSTSDAPQVCFTDPSGEFICEEEAAGAGVSFVAADGDEAATGLADFFEQEIFTEENIESSTATSIVYRIPTNKLCRSSTASGGPDGEFSGPVETTEINQGCADIYEANPIRLRLTSPAEGTLQVGLLLGDSSNPLLTLKVSEGEVRVTLDLGSLRSAMEIFADDPQEVPSVLEGKIAATLTRHAAQDYEVAFSVLSQVRFEMSAKDQDISFAMGTADPAISVRADNASKMLTAFVGMGALDMNFPMGVSNMLSTDGDPNSASPEEMHQMGLHLGGLNGSITLNTDGAEDVVTFNGLGLGDTTTTLSVDGQQVLGLDLNPDSGRRFSATLSESAEDMIIEVDPAFALMLALNMDSSQGLFANNPAWVANEVISIVLDGATKPSLKLGEQIEVLAGKLTLTSSSQGEIVIEAGQCLLTPESTATAPVAPGEDPAVEPDMSEDAHPFSDLNSGTCQ